GIWIAVAAAFAPLMYLLGLLGILVLAVTACTRARVPLAAAALVPVLLLGPWMLERVLMPMRWWWEAGFASGYVASAWDIVLGRAGGPGAAPAWLSLGVLVLGVMALVPSSTRREVVWVWLFALVGLAVAALGSVSTFTTPSSPAEVAAWVGIPVVIWIAGLATAAMIAADGQRGLGRPITTALVLLALLLPIGTGTWWLVRGEEDPVTRGALKDVPAFLVTRPGSTLVVEGDIPGGVDYQVFDGDGLRLGEEAVLPTVEESRPVTALVRRILSNPTRSDLTALAKSGVGAIYAPDADPELARRLDAAPGLEPAGSEDPESRVWTLPQEPTTDTGSGSIWNPVVAGVQVLLWLFAIILTAPVRQRRRTHEADS
ncbi:hypothetical protein, partial [Aeromicrobium sp.]